MGNAVTRFAWVVSAAALVAGCNAAGPSKEAPSNPPPCFEASPGVYELLAENESFRVIAATWDAGEKDDWHSHPPLAAYFLTDVQGKLHYPDGSSKDVSGKAGEVKLLGDHETHYYENTGAAECRMILFERVHTGVAPSLPDNARPLCTDASPEVYKLLGENDLLRVVQCTWAPGKQDEWHTHPPLAAYALTAVDGRLRYETSDDKEVKGDAGLVKLIPQPDTHAFQNAGDAECRILLVELK